MPDKPPAERTHEAEPRPPHRPAPWHTDYKPNVVELAQCIVRQYASGHRLAHGYEDKNLNTMGRGEGHLWFERVPLATRPVPCPQPPPPPPPYPHKSWEAAGERRGYDRGWWQGLFWGAGVMFLGAAAVIAGAHL